jgi:nucleoside-diphosphate-sugar epimerase
MVFITGGTGFIGAYIIKNLVEKGIAVRAIRRSAVLPFYIPQAVFDKVEWVTGDVLDVVGLDEAVHGAEAVIHSAAVVSFHAADRERMYQTNIEGTANVVNAALANNVDRFIHISSVAALGRSAAGEPVTEDHKWEEGKATTHYGITKRLAELQAWRGFAEGLEGVVLNPSTVLGFGNWNQSSCAIFKHACDGFPWYPTGVNGFVGVENVAEAAVHLLQSGLHQKRFIISAENWPFQQLLNTLADGFGTKRPHLKATPFLGTLATGMEQVKAAFTGKKPLLSAESAQVAQRKVHFDNSALLQALPTFSYTPLSSVIQKACTQYKQAVAEGTL